MHVFATYLPTYKLTKTRVFWPRNPDYLRTFFAVYKKGLSDHENPITYARFSIPTYLHTYIHTNLQKQGFLTTKPWSSTHVFRCLYLPTYSQFLPIAPTSDHETLIIYAHLYSQRGLSNPENLIIYAHFLPIAPTYLPTYLLTFFFSADFADFNDFSNIWVDPKILSRKKYSTTTHLASER
jgi:hypothetical protein